MGFILCQSEKHEPKSPSESLYQLPPVLRKNDAAAGFDVTRPPPNDIHDAVRPESVSPRRDAGRGDAARTASAVVPGCRKHPWHGQRGAWVFKGTRTPVAIVFENLEDGMTIDEVMEQFPVTREQVKAVLEFAARSSTRRCPGADARSLRQRD